MEKAGDALDQMRKGTTSLAILKVLADASLPMHGYQLIQVLESRSQGYFLFKEGLIYPRLHQMEREGWLRSLWVGEPGTRRRKVYAITDEGRSRLLSDLAQWQTFSLNMALLLGTGNVSG
jgi:PadR family transcriptional regulator PadR